MARFNTQDIDDLNTVIKMITISTETDFWEAEALLRIRDKIINQIADDHDDE